MTEETAVQKTEAAKTDTDEAPEKPLRTLGRDDILKSEDIEYRYVDVPEWGGRLRIRSMTAAQAAEFSEQQEKGLKNNEAAVVLIRMSAVDESDELLFTNEDIKRLRKKSLRPIVRIQDAALELNGLGPNNLVKVKNA